MTNPAPPGQVPDALPAIQRFEVVDCIDSKHVPAVTPKPHGPWVRYEDHAAALCRLHAENKALRAQQDDAYDNGPQAETVEEAARDVGKWLNERPNRPLDLRHVAMLTHHAKRTAHVQNPAEIEHVAGDVSKNGAELNTSTQQPAPAGATPAESVERIVHLRAYRERRIYVAGPMTGLPEYNFPLFNSTAVRLRSEGWHVENPAEHGHVEGAGWADYLRWDISRIATCGAIYLLPGWSNSKGATLEVHIAGVLGLEVLLADGAEAPTPQPTPAPVLHLVHSAFAEVAMAFPKAFALHKVGIADTAVREALAAPATQQAVSSAVLKAIREANMQLVRTGDYAFMLVPYKVATAQAADSVPAVSDLPPLPDPDLRDVGTKPQDVKDFLNGYATEYARLALAARARWGQPSGAGEPVALLVRKNSWRDGQWEAAPPNSPSYGLAWANQRVYVYTTPQPTHAQTGAVPLTCEWTHSEDDGFWETACGEAWRFDDGGPGENNMHFCHSCGNSLRIKGGQHGTE